MTKTERPVWAEPRWSEPGPGGLRPLRVMYLYAAEDQEARTTLHNHLWGLRAQRLIETWDHSELLAGQSTDTVERQLRDADVAVVLVSSDLFGDNTMLRLLDAATTVPSLRLIVIRYRDYDLTGTTLAGQQALPTAGPTLRSCPDRDATWREVAQTLNTMLRTHAAQGLEPLPVPLAVRQWVSFLRGELRAYRQLALPLLLGVVVLSLWQLGAEVHRARLVVLGVSPQSQGLSYPGTVLVRTGVATVLRLGQLMLVGPLRAHGGEFAPIPILLSLLGGALLLGRYLGGRARAAWLVLWLPLCFVGVVWLRVGVRQQHLILYSKNPPFTTCRLQSPNDQAPESLVRQIGAEVCSWLYNRTPEDAERLSALLGGWGIATLGMLAANWLLLRTRGMGLHGRTVSGLAGLAYGLLGLWLLVEVPRAGALDQFGLRYPVVRRLSPSCGAALSTAVDQGRCRAWDLGAEAKETLLLLRGDCLGHRSKDLLFQAQRCVEQTDNPEVVEHGQ